jgi:hypothetical protein
VRAPLERTLRRGGAPGKWAALALAVVTSAARVPRAAEYAGSTVRIVTVDGEDAEGALRLTVDRAHVGGGVAVDVVKWPPDGGDLWVRVRSLDVHADACYGPARRSGHDTWRIPDVRLGDGRHERRELELQAFVSPAGSADNPACELRASAAVVMSPPVRVTVGRRDPGEQDGRIRIGTLDRDTVIPDEPSVVGPWADIAGTLAEGATGLVYVLAGTRGGPIWEVLGRAERSGGSWILREAGFGRQIADDDERVLVAVLVAAPMHGSQLSYAAWRAQTVAASPSVRVIVRPVARAGDFTLDGVAFDGQVEHAGMASPNVTVAALEKLERLEGAAPAGADPIWVVTASPGALAARLHGPAARDGARWSFDGPSLRDPGHLEGDTIFAYAITSPTVPHEGLVLVERTRGLARAVSTSMTLHLSPGLPHVEPPTLSLTSIGGGDVDDGVAVTRAGSTMLAGTIGGLASGQRTFLRAAIRLGDGAGWLLSPEIVPRAERWALSDFAALDVLERDGVGSVVVIATAYPLLDDVLDARELASLPLAASPTVLVARAEARLPHPGGQRADMRSAAWLAAVFLLVGLFVWSLNRRSSMISSNPSSFSKSLAELDARIRRATEPLLRSREASRLFDGQPGVVDQALGLLILGALALAISFYIPLYQKVIGVVLDAPSISRNLSVALITFAALAGVLLEAAPKLLAPVAGARLVARVLKHALASAVGLVTAACTVALCVVNTLIYASYYQRQAPAVALAFGGAALLMSVTEVVGFFVGLRLGFALFVWLLVAVLVRLPLAATRAVAALLAHARTPEPAERSHRNDHSRDDPTASAPATWAAPLRNGSPDHRRPDLARLDGHE